ncbi:MAG: cytochrome-c peroxidase [Balneola sp.]
MAKYLIHGLILIGAAYFISCESTSPNEDPEIISGLSLPSDPLNYSTTLPNHFLTNDGGPLPTRIQDHDNQPTDNPTTDAGATLGRVLFYDKNLSLNGTISCGSCHSPALVFSDSSTFSIGFDGGETRRHSMSLIFARYYDRGRFFWDERAETLEDQVLMPIQDEVEMGLTYDQIKERIEEQDFYPDLFEAAFGSPEITQEKAALALAQFVRSIVSVSSKYDEGRAQVNTIGDNFPNFTAQENLGKQLFLRPIINGGAACFGCHTTEAFINPAPGATNNGLDEVTGSDAGVFETFDDQRFDAAFKVTSLRNIELSGPYMHDGRFETLEEVVEHYNSGIKDHPNLAPALTAPDGSPVRLNLTETEVDAIVAFLKTLTDNTLATDERWSDPFLFNE